MSPQSSPPYVHLPQISLAKRAVRPSPFPAVDGGTPQLDSPFHQHPSRATYNDVDRISKERDTRTHLRNPHTQLPLILLPIRPCERPIPSLRVNTPLTHYDGEDDGGLC